MTSRGAAVVAALAVAVALGCWWMLDSAVTDAPDAAPSDAAPTTPRPKMKRRRAPVAGATSDATPPAAQYVYETGSLLVRVKVAATEQPFAGADVYVADRHDKEYTAKTDAAGVARFDALPQGDVRLLVESAGFVRESNFFILVYSDSETEFDVALERGAAATGVVLDETGRPLADASAMATGGRDDWLYDDVTPLAEATTAADGTFRLATLPADGPSFLQLTAPGYAVRTIEWNPAPGGRVEARLVRAGRLEGRVREPSGRPAVDAHVRARTSAPDQPEHWETTDAEGQFVVEKLPVGVAWTVRAEKDGFIDSTPVDVVVRDGGSVATCEPHLRRRPRLEFLVLDAAGAPVDAAEVDVKDASGRFEPRQCVKGRATFDVAEAGACRVVVDAPRFVPHEETVDVAVDETKQVVVRPDAGASLAGVVVDDAGAPVAGAAIEVVGGTVAGFGGWTRSATSGADGAFRVEGLTAGAHRVHVDAEHHETWRNETTAPSDAMRVVLPRFGRLTIRLRAPANEPPPGSVGLRVTESDDAPRRDQPVKVWPNLGVEILKSDTPWCGASWSDVLQLQAGKRRVSIDVRGFLPETRDVDVAAGSEAVLDEIVLDRGRSVAGVVVDDLGRPVAKAQVAMGVRGDDGDVRGWRDVEVDADGSFRFELIARTVGVVDVRAHVRGGDAAGLSNVVVPCGPLRIALRRNGIVSFRVRGATDEPLASANVQVDDDAFPAPTSGDVRLSFAPATHRIVVRAANYAPTTFWVDVASGGDVRLPDVVLDAGVTLAGRVVDAAGAPVVGARIELGSDRANSDADGRFAVEHLLRVQWEARVTAVGFLDAWFVWSPSSSAPQVVVMRRGGLVCGKIHDVAGAFVRDVRVTVVELDRPGAEDGPSLVRDGSFTSRLPEGRWRIAVWRDGKQVATRDVEVREGDETSIDFVVPR